MEAGLGNFPLNTAMFIRPERLVPSGWTGHVPFGSWLIAAAEPKLFVELGSHFGMSYAAFCQTVEEHGLSTKCYAVDTWQGDEHAGFYGDDVFQDLNQFNEKHFAGFSRLMRMTFDEAATYFADGTVDLLHIDGLHTYEAVKYDFETWREKLSDRAIVLFHDTAVRERGFGVWQFWAEISKEFPHIEFDNSAGLGVLFVGKNQPQTVQELLNFAADEHQLRDMKGMFSVLGESVLRRWELDVTRKEKIEGIKQLQDQLAAKEALLSKATDDVGATSAVIKQVTQDNETLKQKLQQTNESLRQSQETVSQLSNSVSYRVTKPLRLFRRVFAR